ncbi:MAG: 1-acyl-sn-glycerol-3-phosphate acyltransferase [Bacteroidetes bacterium]|nr:1-acyl-sn-glycerol-3-phosphate acyltransferase [Bacteroidota bacterium]
MKLVKDILARILAFWGLVTFVLTFLIIFIPSMFCWLIPDPRGQAIFIRISRIWMHIWLRLVGCPFRIKGKEHFKKGSTYIVTCNHNSLLDIPLSSPFIPGPNKTIAKSSFAKVPLFGFYYMKGALLLNRKSEASRRESFDKMKAILARHIHMCIYPEGTRNRTDQPLKKFHDGAFRLAIETGHAIIPAVILHTKKVLPTNKAFWFWPGKIEMHFLEAIEPAGLSIDALKEKVFTIMSDYYRTNAS